MDFYGIIWAWVYSLSDESDDPLSNFVLLETTVKLVNSTQYNIFLQSCNSLCANISSFIIQYIINLYKTHIHFIQYFFTVLQ